MVDVNVDFVLENDEPINAEFIVEPDVTYTADIMLSAATSFHNELSNRDLPNQHPMGAITGLDEALGNKVDKTDDSSKVYGTDENGDQTTYDVNSFGQVDDVQVGGTSVVTNKIAELGTMAGESATDYSTTAVANTLYADISYEGTIDNHIANKNNPHDVTKAQVGLGNVDNTSDLDKPVSTATQTALNSKQDTISDLSTIRENASHGESAYNTISGYGDVVTHNASDFATSAQGGLADTALQPNDDISELNNDVGYITSASIPTNYVTTDTAQTITPQKAFSSPLVVADNNGLATGTILSNKKILQKNSSGIEVGNSTEDILLVGKSTTTNPKYNGNDLALKSDIPTMTASTGIDITSNAISVTDPTLVNNGTGTKALAVGKTSQSAAEGGVAVGYGAQANSTYGTAVGYESRASNTNTTVIGKGAKATQARAIAIGSGAEATAQDAIAIKGINNTANTFQVYTYNMLDMSTGLIPDARINSSTFATKNYVDDSVSTNTAYFDGSWATYADIPSTVAGFTNESLPEPTNNNYLVVLEDETQDGGTWRYKYVDDGQAYNKNKWAVEYEVNETPLTQAQLDALNSGVTSADVGLAQSALQSGDNISELVNNSGYITGISSSDVTTALGYTPYNSTNPSGYISGITSSDVTTALGYTPQEQLVSGTNIKTINSQSLLGSGNISISAPTYTAGTGIDITSNTISVTAPTLTNKATGTNSVTIVGNNFNASQSVNVGAGSKANGDAVAYGYNALAMGGSSVAIGNNASSAGSNSTVVGRGAEATTSTHAIAIGAEAISSANMAIQLGRGTNSTAKSLSVGFGTNASDNYQLLDGTTGLIPDARISTNIARTSAIPTVDGVTIDTNLSDELEAIGTVNKNTAVGATAVKYDWVGTLAEYNSQNVETLHPEWVCYITDDVSGGTSVYTKAEVDSAISTALTTMLDSAFPVGSRYITEANTCPLATLIPNSTWVLTSQGRVLQGADSNHASGTTAEAGLPNITGEYIQYRSTNYATLGSTSGAFAGTVLGGTSIMSSDNTNGTGDIDVRFNASNSNSIYGNSTTVQPPAEFVNIFKRTA